MNLPNTFLIGVQKGGTTALYDSLSQHKDILAPALAKDYHHFAYERNYQKGLKTLSSFYDEYQNEKIIINAAVNYIYIPDSIERLKAYNPDARLIVILRNPIHRAISAYKDFFRLGMETLAFEDALLREKQKKLTSWEEKSSFAYLDHGMYYNQLQHLLKHFDKDQLHVLFFEDLLKDKQTEFKALFKFLNIDPFAEIKLNKHNQSVQPKFKWLNELVLGQNKFKSFIKVFKVEKIIPAKTFQRIFQYIRNKNITDSKIKLDVTADTIMELKECFEQNVSQLSTLLNRDLSIIWPEFKTTH